MATKYVVTCEQDVEIDRRMMEIKRQLRQKDGSPLDPGSVAVALQCIVEGKMSGAPTPATYSVTVDYAMPLADMIAAGKYDWKNDDITVNHFTITLTGVQESELVLVHLNHLSTTEEVMKYLDDNGLRPATLAELLAFGAKYPELQQKFPVVALGSVWRYALGSRHVPYLSVNNGKRKLGLRWHDNDWNDYCRFLAVRK